MVKTVYYCPECKSENVETICFNPPSPLHISMDDIGSTGRIQHDNLVYNQYQYQAKCKDCGYSVDFSM